MKEIYMDAFSEVNAILNIMPSNLFNKIPLKFRQMISEYKNNSYNPRIEEPVEDYELKDETKIIEEQLREKYNPDNIFNNRKTENIETIAEPVAMVEYKESFFTKILNRIKNIFRKG